MLMYFAIYNTTTHEAEDPANVGPIDDSETENVYIIVNGREKKDGTSNLSELRKISLLRECGLRGIINGEWKLYMKSEPFDWANLVGDTVLSATEKAEHDKAAEEAAKKAAEV